MSKFTKHLFGCVLVAVMLVIIFGILAPLLISAPSTFLAALGFGLLIVTAVGSVVLVRHTLGLGEDQDSDNQ